MAIIQLVPTLDQGPASSSVIAINHCLIKQRVASFVVCNGGARVGEVTDVGGSYVPMDLADKNPLSMVERAGCLKALLERVSPDVMHVHGRVAAWIGSFANLNLRIPVVSTLHRTYSQNAFSEVMWRVGPLIPCPQNWPSARWRCIVGCQPSRVYPPKRHR